MEDPYQLLGSLVTIGLTGSCRGSEKSGHCEGEGKGSGRSAAVDKATEPSGSRDTVKPWKLWRSVRLAQPLPQVAASQAWQGPSKTGPATGYVSPCFLRGQPGLVAGSVTTTCSSRARLGSVSLWASVRKAKDRQSPPPKPPSPFSYSEPATHSSTINMCALFTLSILIKS